MFNFCGKCGAEYLSGGGNDAQKNPHASNNNNNPERLEISSIGVVLSRLGSNP